MAASNTDKFRSATSGTRPETAYLTAPKSVGTTSVTVSTTTGWATDTGTDFIIYKKDITTGKAVPGSLTTWVGVVGSGTISNMLLKAGTEPVGGYASGEQSVVMATPTAAWSDNLVDALLQTHSQAGTLLPAAVDAGIAPGSITTAKLANSAVTPAKWTNPYKFRAYRSAAYNTVSNTITALPFDTENFDSNNNFASNTYTAPVAGFYQFNARIGLGSVTNIAFLVLYKNGSEISRGNALQYTTNPMGLILSDMIQLAQGDTIDVRYSINGAVAINVGTSETFFGGYLISQT